MTDEFKSRIAKIVTLLENVAGNRIDSGVALQQWPDIETETDKLLAASWHDLSHFAADRDIRDRDPSYATYQRDLLLDRAKKIKEKFNL